MPVLAHAKKKLRADRRKRIVNRIIKTKVLKSLDRARKEKKADNLRLAFSALDKAAKKGVFHQRKSDRLKSRLAKQISLAK